MEPLESNENTDRWSGLKTRAISGVILAAGVLTLLWLGGWLFNMLVLIAAIIMVQEWNGLNERESGAWRIAGLFYAAIPCASLIWLREIHIGDLEEAGLGLVLFVVLCVWATDIGAYFAGSRFGGTKLAPSISPKKTWSGLGGGMLAAAITGVLCHSFNPFPATLFGSFTMGALLAVVSQAGDLFESWIKRRAGVKDSGTLIPGHGGLLDRIDGLTFALPFFAFCVYWMEL